MIRTKGYNNESGVKPVYDEEEKIKARKLQRKTNYQTGVANGRGRRKRQKVLNERNKKGVKKTNTG